VAVYSDETLYLTLVEALRLDGAPSISQTDLAAVTGLSPRCLASGLQSLQARGLVAADFLGGRRVYSLAGPLVASPLGLPKELEGSASFSSPRAFVTPSGWSLNTLTINL